MPIDHSNVFFQMIQTSLNKANPSGLPSNLVLNNFVMPTDKITVNTVVQAITTQLGYSYGWGELVATAGAGTYTLTEPLGNAWLLKLHAQIPPGASVSLSAAVGSGTSQAVTMLDPAQTLVYGDPFRWQTAHALGPAGMLPWNGVEAWPDPAATWLGPTETSATSAPVGQWLLRKWIFVPASDTYTVVLAVAETGTLCVDGAILIQATQETVAAPLWPMMGSGQVQTAQATTVLNPGFHLVSLSILNTGAVPGPTGALLSITNSQGVIVENGSTDARVGCTWETTELAANTAWTTVTSASDLLDHWGVIPASLITSEDVTLTVASTANSSDDAALIHGVDWITVAPWRWDAGGQYDATASTSTPAQVNPRQIATTVG